MQPIHFRSNSSPKKTNKTKKNPPKKRAVRVARELELLPTLLPTSSPPLTQTLAVIAGEVLALAVATEAGHGAALFSFATSRCVDQRNQRHVRRPQPLWIATGKKVLQI